MHVVMLPSTVVVEVPVGIIENTPELLVFAPDKLQCLWGGGGVNRSGAFGGGGGGCWHDAWLCCYLQRAAPIGLSPLTAALPLNPFPP